MNEKGGKEREGEDELVGSDEGRDEEFNGSKTRRSSRLKQINQHTSFHSNCLEPSKFQIRALCQVDRQKTRKVY